MYALLAIGPKVVRPETIDWARTFVSVVVYATLLMIPVGIVVSIALLVRRSNRAHERASLENEAERRRQAQEAPPPPSQGYPAAPYSQGYAPAPMVYQQAAPLMWTCPFCRFQGPPRETHKITTAGWIIFFFMLFSCVGTLFCWLPLLLTQRRTLCPNCSTAVGA